MFNFEYNLLITQVFYWHGYQILLHTVKVKEIVHFKHRRAKLYIIELYLYQYSDSTHFINNCLIILL